MIDVYRKILQLLDRGERRRFYILMVLMVLVTFAEVLSITSILPLLAVLADPGLIETNRYLAWTYERFGFTSTYAFQVFLSVAVFVAMLAGLALKAAGTYAMTRFSTMRGFTISSRLLQAYLHQPYSWFLERNSAAIRRSVLGEVGKVVNSVILPGITVVASLMLATFIIAVIVMIDPVIAVTSALLMGGGYGLIYLRIRDLLARLGKEGLEANRERFQLTQEATGGVKEVKLMGLEDSYVRRFNDPSRRVARVSALNQLLGQLPRYLLEALAFGTLLGLILILLLRNAGDLVAIIPTLGFVAFSVMRLLPALQQVYRGIASMRGAKVVLDHIHADYTAALTQRSRPRKGGNGPPMLLTRRLELDGISYAYAAAERTALQDLALTIPAGSTVGVVGGTGAGKTTLVDLILGLLTPQAGEIRVDGTPITPANLRAWQKSLGYVPQSIYLVDASVAQNIAFGVSEDRIDMVEVERAARIAALHDFVLEELPKGYQTVVGERGVRLSGGQRQRIGIARALYHDPSLLILDEATSALDNLTERAVMEAVHNIAGAKTVIMIAHRLSTVRNCDTIFLLEQGQVVSQGTFDELVAGNETFRRMAANG
jgi:ATP-binding cassette, subfamily B, bacterial PglK